MANEPNDQDRAAALLLEAIELAVDQMREGVITPAMVTAIAGAVEAYVKV